MDHSTLLIMTILVTLAMVVDMSPAAEDELSDDFIQVRKPMTLGVDRLPAQRISVGIVGDYKPCIAQLPNGQLLLVMFYSHYLEDGRYQEDIILYRSNDGGLSWSERQGLALLGREPHLTVLKDGTVFITVHFLSQDWRNEDGYTHSYLHRSADGGNTWTSMRIGPEDLPGAAPQSGAWTTRNVLELPDGGLLMGVSAPNGVDYLWQSVDRGQTWDKSLDCQFKQVGKEKAADGLFSEAHLWQARSGKLYAICRVNHQHFPLPGRVLSMLELYSVALDLRHYNVPLVGDITKTGYDSLNRLKVFSSDDKGRTWEPGPDLGDYGYLYPSILGLQDGRLLLSFTCRALDPPYGARAVLGTEEEDGFKFDFEHDMMVVGNRNAIGRPGLGGLSPTVQLDDSTLVTAYSYWSEEAK